MKMFLTKQIHLDLPTIATTIRTVLAHLTLELRTVIPSLELFTDDELRSSLSRFVTLVGARQH